MRSILRPLFLGILAVVVLASPVAAVGGSRSGAFGGSFTVTDYYNHTLANGSTSMDVVVSWNGHRAWADRITTNASFPMIVRKGSYWDGFWFNEKLVTWANYTFHVSSNPVCNATVTVYLRIYVDRNGKMWGARYVTPQGCSGITAKFN